VIVEHGSRFVALDGHTARRAATNVALELAAERRAARAEWDARASLAGELIRGTTDANALRRRAEYLGVELRAPHVACLVAGGRDGALPPTAELVRAFDAHVPQRGLLATAVAEGVLLVLPLDDGMAPLDAVTAARGQAQAALEQLTADGPLLAAISARCTETADYVRAYTEARQVMSCLRSFAAGERPVVLTADDLGPGRLFLASASQDEAERFARDALGALLAEGDDLLADLLHTLQVYFDSARSVRRASQQLGVHENTIRYRLARVHELTGLAVGSDSGDELTAHLALLILRMQALATHPRATSPRPRARR
jgi:sugar diacid utilization regulator